MAQKQHGTSRYWDGPPGRKTMNSRGDLGAPPTGNLTMNPPSTSSHGDPQLPANAEQNNPVPGAVGHIVSTQSQNLSDSGNLNTMTQSVGSGTAATTTTTDSLEPWRVDLTQNTVGTPRSSTPADELGAFQGRRSPANQSNETEGGLSHEAENNAGSTNNRENTVLLAENISKNLTMAELMLFTQLLDNNIEAFGAEFRNQVGWHNKLKTHTANLTDSLRKLISNAKRLQAKRELQKLYPLETVLNEHAENLKKIAETEKEAQGSPFVFRVSSLDTPVSTIERSTRHRSLEDLLREGTAVEDISISETDEQDQTRRGRIPTNLALRALDMKVKSLEVRKADMHSLQEVVNSLATKASKTELSDACMRICNLEARRQEIINLTTDVDNLKNSTEEDMRNMNVLIDGLCKDGSTQELRIEEAMEMIKSLRQELDEMKNQSRSTSETTAHLGLAGFEGNSPRYRRPHEPSVSGISVYTTQTNNTQVTVSNPGYLHTNLVLTSGTRPTSQVFQSAFPPPQSRSMPYVQQPGSLPQNREPSQHHSQSQEHQAHNPNTGPGVQHPPQEDIYQRTRGPESLRVVREAIDKNIQPRGDTIDLEIERYIEQGLDRSNSTESISERGSLPDDQHAQHSQYLIKESMQGLEKMLQPPIDDKLTKTIVQGVLKSIVPAVDTERKDLQALINNYSKEVQTHAGREIINDAQLIITMARSWSIGMRSKYNELDCAKQPLDAKLFEGLKKFSEQSDTNIFEFLYKFEAFTEEKGTAKERAALLYESYLHYDIQMMLIEHKEDYKKMRAWLINRYGDVKVMTDNILRTITKEKIPSDSSSSVALTNYYRKFNSVIKRIEELQRTTDMPIGDLHQYIYSSGFLEKLCLLLPDRAKDQFLEKHDANNEDLHRIQGKKAFEALASVVQASFKRNETKTRMEGPEIAQSRSGGNQPDKTVRKKNQGAHTATNENYSSGEENERQVHYQRQEPNKSKRKESQPKKPEKKSNEKPKQDGNSQATKKTYNFPCPLDNHFHEVGTCTSFFSAKPHYRFRAAFRRMCYRCLGPSKKCAPKCTAKMPTDLVCPECQAWADKNGKAGLNVLFCTRSDHSKPDEKTTLDALKKHIPGFKAGDVQGKLVLAAHFHLSAHTAASNKSTLTSKPDPDSDVPVINTCTGELVETPEKNIIPESTEDAFYIMQILNLRGQDVLTFYDSGANSHLIDGSLAEDINLKVISEDGVNIQVVGGNKMWSNYGTYGMTLGPTEDEYYHKISAQGVGVISKQFNYYDFKEINREVRASGELSQEYQTLPKYIGGQPPKLLLGIKDTGLNPELLFQLPCGLGVYRSQLKDKFGSRICYGGPHKTFTEANKIKGTHFNQIDAFFLSMVTQYENSPYVSIAHSLKPDLEDTGHGVMLADYSKAKTSFITEDNMVVYPSALTAEAIEGLDITELEDSDDDPDFCACEPINNTPMAAEELGTQIFAHKAKVPVSKRKEYFDAEDQGFASNYRCEDCTKCKKCSLSDKSKMMSLQEKMEQEAIEKSVHIDLNQRKVFVDLPFIKPPVDALRKRHNADSNYKQALRIYQSQCRKPPLMRSAMVKVHEDLVGKSFMRKLSDLNPEQKKIINNAQFKHYMPWNIAEKPESTSTPVRMVVDASVTGLNEILAKGENKMSKINNILIRNRCRRYIWTSDISKLYNQLHLNDSALPYALFLFSSTLNIADPPETYVMTRAWYGVSPTGNQSTETLIRLTSLLEENYPLAVPVVKEDLYVDDTITGSNDKAVMQAQIHETLNAFSEGGFQLKYVVRSGETPCEEASPDGKSLKILGYRWSPKEDILNPGFGEVNFNKKKRGAKKPNPFSVETQEDVAKLLNTTLVTRRMVVSKIAEMWDPVGIWEPFKVQLKLDNSYLNGLDWDVPLNCELQTHWKERFQHFINIPNMEALRCIIPEDAVDPNDMRLLCLSDAAENAGGCAVYASFKRINGTFSCQLLTARSKLMSQKIPRNELEAIKLMAETVFQVKQALRDQVKETLYFTDSTIAMCWCHNMAKKLRMYTLYRVADIRRNILGSAYHDHELPLYHIDGKLNAADLLTKHNSITPEDLSRNSVWHEGYPWMRLALDDMPVTTYKQLTISKDDMSTVDQECFPEPIMSKSNKTQEHQVMYLGIDTMHCTGCQSSEAYTTLQVCYGIDEQFDHCDECSCPIQFSSFALKVGKGQQVAVDVIQLGWLRSLKRLSYIMKFASLFQHKSHLNKNIMLKENCCICTTSATTQDPIEQDKIYYLKAKQYLFRQESIRIKSIMTKQKLAQFTENDGILYYESRLNQANQICQSDLDINVFYDNAEFNTMLPVVLSDSEIFFAFAVHVHHKVRPHAGIELTLKEISKTMMVLNNPRRVIQCIRKHCPRCRIISKRTAELRMMHHPAARTHLAPPFYHCQVDTVFGFKGQAYKNSRKTFKMYALVIVCLLTGATSILAIEGLETQDVIQAIERHSARHGVPAVMFVDNGTQLIALEHATFSIRDVETHLHDSLGMRIVVSNAKSHEERGRVEAKVKVLRNMLEKLSVKAHDPMTAIQWETLFAKISSRIDDVPIAKCTNSNLTDPGWDIITANRLKLGRNNNRALEGCINLPKGVGADKLLRRNQEIQKLWYQMLIDRIHHLIPRPAKWGKTDVVNVGDICLFIYSENAAMGQNTWKLGRIKSIPKKNKVIIEYPGTTTVQGIPKKKTLSRCPRTISIISAAGDVELNSRSFYNDIVKNM